MTTLADLLATKSPDDALAFMIAKFIANGVQATAWQSGAMPMQLLQGESAYLAELDATIAKIAQGGLIDLAAQITPEGGPGWLDLLCAGFFQENRKAAVFTRGKATLTDVAGNGPTPVLAGKVVASDGTRRFTFQNIQGGTIPHLGSLTLDWTATSPGAAWNLSNGSLTVLQSSLPGVTISNPAIAGTSSWITQQGTDVERNALYVARCKNKWGTLGDGSTDSGYLYRATNASLEVTRTKLLELAGGVVTIVLAGESGPLSSDAFTAVDAALQAKRTLCTQLTSMNASGTATNIAGTVYVDGAYDLTATLAAVQASVLAYARSTAIGGLVVLDKIIGAIADTPGVSNLVLTSPLADLPLSGTQVFTPNFLLTASR